MSTTPDVRDGKHWLGFLVSGVIAFAVDAGTTKLLTSAFGVPVLASRLAGIGLAMVAGWLCHRRLTFRVAAAPTLAEFLKYAGVAWTASAINYGVFAVILAIWPALEPVIALFASSLVAMAVAYAGMRFAAFRAPQR